MGGRGDGPEVKKRCWMEKSQLFLSETVIIVLGTYRTEGNALTNYANPCSKQMIVRKFLFHSLPDFLDELARKRLLRRLKQEVIIGPIMISCSKVLTLK